MFYNYKIKHTDNGDILYLFFNYKYETSIEFINNNDLARRTNNFIRNNNIDFNGKKVYLIINGINVKCIDLGNSIEILDDKMYFSNDNYMVNVMFDNKKVVEVSLKYLLIGCLAEYLSFNFNLEVLKALSVLFRTYIFKEMNNNNFINYNNNFFEYKDIIQFKLRWIDNYEDNLKLLSRIIDDTDCIFLTYNNNYILPFFHLTNDGFTRSNKKYKYIKSVKSYWDYLSPYYINIKIYTYRELSQIFNDNITSNDIYEEDKLIIFKGKSNLYTQNVIKDKLNLNSNHIILITYKDYIKIIYKGFGDFYGLSLFGADELAKNGCDYLNILKYYFPTITFNKYIKEKELF